MERSPCPNQKRSDSSVLQKGSQDSPVPSCSYCVFTVKTGTRLQWVKSHSYLLTVKKTMGVWLSLLYAHQVNTHVWWFFFRGKFPLGLYTKKFPTRDNSWWYHFTRPSSSELNFSRGIVRDCASVWKRRQTQSSFRTGFIVSEYFAALDPTGPTVHQRHLTATGVGVTR